MKKKYLIATHGELASGFQSSLEILAGRGNEITKIDAYVTEEDYTPVITSFIDSVSKEEQGIIFTDLFGGSVNQKVVTELMLSKKDNVFVLSNVNLAVILSIMFLSEETVLDTKMIQNAIEESKVMLVPTILENDEEDFF
ncbi:PTS sugar transporter subunit IIA [Vagococcus sp.]|uniref:PTS sugar transporter subunit IIA n=1 Tax=Vagococcus sp. TaxID=1933889 RepID=UPI002FCC0CD2